MPARDELATLRAENARLITLLESHGIEWHPPQTDRPVVLPRDPEPSRLSTAEKVALFGRLFRGRTDVYPIRWESKTTGKSGYSPACANEWRTGVCEKPRIKCGDCSNRLLTPLSEGVIFNHPAGEHTVGVYPLLDDDCCYFLVVDFDEADWRDDARAFIQSCQALGVGGSLFFVRFSPFREPLSMRVSKGHALGTRMDTGLSDPPGFRFSPEIATVRRRLEHLQSGVQPLLCNFVLSVPSHENKSE